MSENQEKMKELCVAVHEATGIPIERLKELQNGTSKPTLEEVNGLSKAFMEFDLNDLLAMADIPPI